MPCSRNWREQVVPVRWPPSSHDYSGFADPRQRPEGLARLRRSRGTVLPLRSTASAGDCTTALRGTRRRSSLLLRWSGIRCLCARRWPRRDAAGAAYWAAKGRWDECVSVGAAAVEPLITALADGRGFVRRGAAKALAALYHGGGLDERARQSILARSAMLSQPHTDSVDDCDNHQDLGIGVAL